MEGSIIGGPILSAPEAGVLDLDPALHHHPLHHQQALSHHLQGLAPLSSTQHLNLGQDLDSSLGFDTSKSILLCGRGKSVASSDDDEPSFTEDGDGHLAGKSKKGSPWQRMKWTDAMVKLLIHVVILVGEDVTNEMVDCNKKKSGILQKKGKWKSVSRVMNEKGCYVSPQQCEDKFNDLNKRYKRLNDILGKGIACCVVEEPSLLDTMDNIPPKSKDDVRKILSSKQLFYKEICAYHSGCKSLLPSVDFELQRSVHIGNMGQSQDYLDMGRHHNGIDGGHEDDEDDEDDGDKDDDEDYEDHDLPHSQPDAGCGFSTAFGKQTKPIKQADGPSSPFLKYAMGFALDPPSNMDQLLTMQEGVVKLTAEQQHSIRAHMVQIEEQKVGLLAQALELERQRFKWERVNSKRYRELEQLRLDNKKMKLENERMSLNLKQKELEVEYKRSEASMSSIDIILERLHSKDPTNFVPSQPIG
ncbi:hypothetical protein GOP47_0001024 [Adiantum capillus-veneris]|uniref:Myb/SANT-like DNA-binding domain-containing protein n=1 Tax=Adiantum capillus-veneris TaxID=13818 RepID=A0A9D4VE29_ADICA|nr:hypothetical protein GOP47_0001024 [Adiantum capillus-veneris]